MKKEELELTKKAQALIDKKYELFRDCVNKVRDVRSFSILKEVKVMVKNYKKLGIAISTKSVNELFTDEEREKIYKNLFLKGYHGKHYTSLKDTYYWAQDFAERLGCKPTPEICGEIFQGLWEQEDGFHKSYEYSMLMLFWDHGLEKKYFPINAKIAKVLVKFRSHIKWNGEVIWDQRGMPDKKEGESEESYSDRKEKEITKLIDDSPQIFLFGQHSHYGLVGLGDKVPK